MEHPFEVGETYENRFGEYTVLNIAPPEMDIQYENGETDTVTIAIQTRIYRRKKDEQAAARTRRRKKSGFRRPSVSFSGLAETDFKDNVTGTSYRSRKSFAGLIARQLSEARNVEFLSTAIPRQPRFFVGPPSLTFRNQDHRVKLPKFEVRLNARRLRYSFHIEKLNKEMKDDGYWSRFLEVLAERAVKDEIIGAVAKHDLYWLVHLEEGVSDSGDPLPSKEIRFNTFGPGAHFASCSKLVAFLRDLPKQQWCNIYIAGDISKDEAIAMGAKVSYPIVEAFKSLTPLFQRLLKESNPLE